MIYRNIEFFNTAEAIPYDGGQMLVRYPEIARKTKKWDQTRIIHSATCCEIRFVTDAECFNITLGGGTVYIMKGDLTYMKVNLDGKKTLTIKNPDRQYLYNKVCKDFSPDVWRFVSDDETQLIFYDMMPLDGTFVRPPEKDEVPKKKMALYGSSITHWCWAIDARNSYGYRAGQLLGMDVLNKGLAGSCEMEKECVDYIAGLDVDVIFMELGINVLDKITEEEFTKRVDYAFSVMPKDKEIYATGLYDCWFSLDEKDEYYEKFKAFNKIVKETAEKYDHINYISPKKIMDDPLYLCYDMIHPSDFGHIQMSINLVNEIQNIRNGK